MRLIKVGIGSVNSTVGAVRSNADRVVEMARAMAADDVTLAAFPEQVVGGYPPEDLVQWRGFVAAQREELGRIAVETARLGTVLVVGVVVGVGGELYNAAAVIHAGEVVGLVPKEKLPTYDVFYEARVFSRGGEGLALDAGGVPLGDYIFDFDFGTVAVEVCEDMWTPGGPMHRRCLSGAEVVVNISASPYRVGVVSTRRELLATRSADSQAAVVYACKVGAQDGLIYDGGGYVYQNGRPLLDAPRFREGWWSCVVDLDRTIRLRRENTTWREEAGALARSGARVPVIEARAATRERDGLSYPAPSGGSFFLPAAGLEPPSPRDEVLDDLFEALSLGVADYFRKTGAFRGIGVAVSGGRDSLLTLLVGWRALERIRGGPREGPDPPPSPERPDEADALPEAGAVEEIRAGRAREGGEDGGPFLRAFYMPSRFSGDATRDAARTICRELAVPLEEVGIDDAFEREAEAAREMLGGEDPDAVTRQNIQARIRAQRMWNWANAARALFLQPSDMSEKAVGYTTIGGDLEGGLSVIANLPKTVVIALLERLHERFGLDGIRKTLETEPGPELSEDQAAEAELMPFRVLDACLHLHAEEKLAPDEVARVLADLFPDRDEAELRAWAFRFARLFTQSIFKWVQAPLSLHVGRIDLERERALQLPVVQRSQWGDGDG